MGWRWDFADFGKCVQQDAGGAEKNRESSDSEMQGQKNGGVHFLAAAHFLHFVRFLSLDRNRLQFEMPAAQKRSRPDEFPRRIIFRCEVALVNRIELFEQR